MNCTYDPSLSGIFHAISALMARPYHTSTPFAPYTRSALSALSKQSLQRLSLETTANVYGHLDTARKRTLADALTSCLKEI